MRNNPLSWMHRSLLVTILSIAFTLLACTTAPVSTRDTKPEQVTAARREPLSYVAPELRPKLRAMKTYFAALGAPELSVDSLAQMRQDGAQRLPAFLPAPAVAERAIPAAPGSPDVRIYVINANGKGPAGTPRPAILHMHGGGFVLGSARAAVPELQKLAARHDCVVVTVEYRLAPETAYPGSLEDNYAALEWLYNNAASLGVDRSRIAVMGDSAGGGHAAMLVLATRNRGAIPLDAQILVYPMLDDRTGSTLQAPYWMGYGTWTPEANVFGWTSLLGVPAGSETVPAGAVPARETDLAGLPPTFIAVGSVDLFVDEDIEYARRLVAAGVPTELLVVPGAYHGFQSNSPDTPLARQFNAAIDTAIHRAFTLPEQEQP